MASSNTAAMDQSDQRLNELGYKPQFRRDMSLFGVLGVSFCAIGILTGMSSAFQTGLFSGGPLGLFWGWNICSLFMLFIALSLAEICSAYPTMGGLYFWVCKMKPDAPFLGFCTGWIYSIAMIFTGTSGNLSVALYLASLASLSPTISRPLTRLEVTFIAWGINILSGVLNTFGTRAINSMSKFSVWWTIGGTVVLVVVLAVKTEVKNDAKFVFTDYENFTGWTSETFVVLLGFLQAVYTLEGCETAAQLAEETTNAALLAPLAIITSIIGSYLVGLAYLLSLLFSIQSIPRIQQTTFAIPIAQLFLDALNGIEPQGEPNGVGKNLTILCLVIIALAQFMAAVTAFTASSRLLYALARDNAVPSGPAVFNPKKGFLLLNRYQAPYVGVWTSVFIGCLVSCAYVGSAVAFNAILSSAAISVMLSYLQPILIRVLWPSTSLPERGPFTLGLFSWSINFASLLFGLITSILFILPTSHPVTVINMNYSVVAIGGIFVIVGGGWFGWGKGVFGGSIRTREGELGDLEIHQHANSAGGNVKSRDVDVLLVNDEKNF